MLAFQNPHGGASPQGAFFGGFGPGSCLGVNLDFGAFTGKLDFDFGGFGAGRGFDRDFGGFGPSRMADFSPTRNGYDAWRAGPIASFGGAPQGVVMCVKSPGSACSCKSR